MWQEIDQFLRGYQEFDRLDRAVGSRRPSKVHVTASANEFVEKQMNLNVTSTYMYMHHGTILMRNVFRNNETEIFRLSVFFFHLRSVVQT